MITMLITIEDTDKVESVKKFISDNNITINWEKQNSDSIWIEVTGEISAVKKQKSDSVWIEVTGEVLVVNKLYDLVEKINRNKSKFFTKIKNYIMKIFQFYTGIITKRIAKRKGVYYVIDLTNPKLKQDGNSL